jgi:iron-sulfur cluster assembly protein
MNNTSTETAPINITPGALNALSEIKKSEGLTEDHGLRVGVKGGGCSGLSYVLGFDEKREDDEEFNFNGLRIFMNKAHGMYLMGMEIDYHDGLDNRGFVFNNPNANETCGCGSSFS